VVPAITSWEWVIASLLLELWAGVLGLISGGCGREAVNELFQTGQLWDEIFPSGS